VASTHYKLDNGAWQTDTQVTIATEGVHTLLYRSTAVLGKVEADKSCTVRIDRRGPATVAPSTASCRRGTYVTLRYRANDPRPGSPTATVTIRIKTLSGKVVKEQVVQNASVNTTLGWRFKCSLAKRVYKFVVLARDSAGNRQSSIGHNYLTVK
jgi:ribosomal protein L40E